MKRWAVFAAIASLAPGCVCITFPGPDAGQQVSSWEPVSASGNDNCGSPQSIAVPGGRFSGDTTALNDDFKVSCASGPAAPDAVFSFTLTERSFVRVDVSGASYDPALALASGCPTPELACNDNALPIFEVKPALERELDPGTWFVLLDGSLSGTQVIGESGNRGSYTLEAALLPIRQADGGERCATPFELTGSGASIRGTVGAAPAAVRLSLPATSDLLVSTADSSAAVNGELHADSCDGPLRGTIPGGYSLGAGWGAERIRLDAGTYFLQLTSDPDGGSIGQGYQLDLAVAPYVRR